MGCKFGKTICPFLDERQRKWEMLLRLCHKGQLISGRKFGVFKSPKNEPKFWIIFALVFKMGKIEKINTLYLSNKGYLYHYNNEHWSILWFDPFEARVEILQNFGSFSGRFEDTKIPFRD